ncbi:MAG TPA: hypothetical protein VGO86_15330 [Candidatus Dormibacteraeota bacterium]
MDLRLVEYVSYLGIAIGLTLFVGRVLYRSGRPFLVDALRDEALADSVNRLLIVGFSLIGLGGAALLLSVDSGLASAADLVRVIVLRTGVLLLMLGGLHLANLAILRRIGRPARPAAGGVRSEPATGRFPY